MKITKVYTKGGDKGQTSLVGGERISKCCSRIEAYGTIDELNSHIGLLVSMISDETDRNELQRIQNCLFNVGTYLATDTETTPLYSSARIPTNEIARLEQLIDEITAILPEQQGFILPGGMPSASQSHVCRTVCRRAERCMVALSETSPLSPEYIAYINRLSDFFFVFAKKLNFNAGCEEKIWHNYCE